MSLDDNHTSERYKSLRESVYDLREVGYSKEERRSTLESYFKSMNDKPIYGIIGASMVIGAGAAIISLGDNPPKIPVGICLGIITLSNISFLLGIYNYNYNKRKEHLRQVQSVASVNRINKYLGFKDVPLQTTGLDSV